MDPSGQRNNGMPSTSASSYLSFSPSENGNFRGQVTHQIMVLQRMYQELKNSFSIEQSKTQQLMKTVTAIKEQWKPVSEKMANLQKFVAKITDENSKLKKGIEDQYEGCRKVNGERKAEVMILRTMIESLTRSVHENRLRAASSGSSVPHSSENISVLKQQMEFYDLKFTEMDHKYHLLTEGMDTPKMRRAIPGTNFSDQIRSPDSDLTFQAFGTTKYDGKINWRIRDFRRRLEDAKRGPILSIYSQPFYTSRYGYKMCLRTYLNGDGIGRNTHISIFFVLMKGEYDASIHFPFKQKVSLILLEQGARHRHISYTFSPDPTSSSFKRPTNDMNIASGLPMFATHDTLNNGAYVVDDTIFIEAIVDTTDLDNF